MTLLNIVLALVPIIDVESRLAFAAKIGGLILIANLIGLAIYLLARKRSEMA